MSGTFTFGIQAFGCNIQVMTACAEAYAMLDRYVFPSLPRTAGFISHPDLVIRIVRSADQFQLLANGVAAASARHVIDLVVDLIRVLDEAVVERLTTLRAVHAGAVLCNGQALLLPGVTHAGKSSLVAELLRRGATYFSDEYALIDPEGLVHPYPRPLLLRNGRPEQFPVLPGECGAFVSHTPAPIGWILFLEYSSEHTWKITPLSQGEAVLALLQNTPHVLAQSPDLPAVFQRAVAGATCYAGKRSEAADAVCQILLLVETQERLEASAVP
ncbi:MAG TPA: hypothetical protein VHT24_09470 [Pseudacidobacterium sp.]|jgi:hypothetical protein|nr:hypothetical protein [Pseudacidobacterium sp.]